jgi:hypothetical protein
LLDFILLDKDPKHVHYNHHSLPEQSDITLGKLQQRFVEGTEFVHIVSREVVVHVPVHLSQLLLYQGGGGTVDGTEVGFVTMLFGKLIACLVMGWRVHTV